MVCACSRSDPTFGLGRSFGGNASNRVGPLAQIRLNLKTDPTRGGLPWRWNGLNFETKPTPPWLGRECLPSQQGAAWVGIPRHPDLTRGELEHMAKSSFRALISRRGGGGVVPACPSTSGHSETSFSTLGWSNQLASSNSPLLAEASDVWAGTGRPETV